MNGVLLLNKEKDYTSRDVVNIVSKELKQKKIGHTGTLDPLATGVLVLCINEATKIAELLTSTYKEYIAEITLGIKTDTLDITGNILEKRKISISKKELEKVLINMTKTYNQEVPIYSAVKVNGKKLYEYARNNQEVVLPKKEVTIKKMELLEYSENKFTIKCLVSKGTYIRSLINDICKELNIIGTMSNLIRTKQGDFNIEDTYKLEDIKNGNYNLISIEEALKNYLKITVDENLEFKIRNGCLLENVYNEDIIIFENKLKKILAIYKIYEKDNTKIKPWKVFNIKE